jgi:hypothetical protein
MPINPTEAAKLFLYFQLFSFRPDDASVWGCTFLKKRYKIEMWANWDSAFDGTRILSRSASMKVEDKFNVEGIAEQLFQEMKDDGEDFSMFDHYWHRIQLNLLSRGYIKSEVTILEGLVMEDVEGRFEQDE